MIRSPRFALLANPGSRRALGFLAACRARGLEAPRIIPWENWLRPGFDPATAFEDVDSLRIETPAEHPEVERLLLRMGAEGCLREGLYPFLAEEDCRLLPDDNGVLRYQRQWYLGWHKALLEIDAFCVRFRLRPMSQPSEIALLFDKLATRERLEHAGVPIPSAAGICRDFDDLVSKMDATGWNRVFLKPCHGSSASGVMAIARDARGRWQATTSAVLEDGSPAPGIRNSKQLRRLGDPEAIRATVDAVCRERALIERWFPKATLNGKVFDLRVVVIGGTPAHVAVRTSRFPITNLHLHNQRGELQSVIEALGESRWKAALDTASAAAAAFPGCHVCGVDLMIGAGGSGQAIAEVNAFGDLLHHELWQGMDPWEAALACWKI